MLGAFHPRFGLPLRAPVPEGHRELRVLCMHSAYLSTSTPGLCAAALELYRVLRLIARSIPEEHMYLARGGVQAGS